MREDGGVSGRGGSTGYGYEAGCMMWRVTEV